MKTHGLLVRAALLALLFAPLSANARAQTANEDAFALAPTPAPPGFGNAIDLDGDRLAVGALGGLTAGFNSGEARIYERQPDGSWSDAATLIPTALLPGDFFGQDVAVDGDHFIGGAPGDDSNGNSAGAAYMFERRTDGTWLEVATLRPSDALPGDTFGHRVALDGGRAVVAASRSTLFPLGRAVFVFDRQPDGTWLEVAKLMNSDAVPNDGFGAAVALDGDRIVVGAPDLPNGAPGPGAMYVFERQQNGTWNQVQRVQGNVTASSGLGSSIALEGDLAAISGLGGVEQVEVMTRDAGGTWSSVQVLDPPDGVPFANFGNALAIDGTTIVVGASLDDTVGGNSGSIHVYEPDGSGSWYHSVELTRGSAAPDDFFGFDVAASAGRFAGGLGSGGSDVDVALFDRATLYHGTSSVSGASGGTHDLLLRAGPARAGDAYALLGSMSGTAPGTTDPVSGFTLPLVFDAYTDLIVNTGGRGVLSPWQGVLDGNGAADATLVVPPAIDPALVGLALHHAYFTVKFTPDFNVTSASNAVRVDLAP
ncbi:hypothetical protein Pla163_01310 [Planctomycetes bacterium Pla163]|uniref:FG-GAP repeat protein n=1 Tax=Rohdeia mirabilis TaxID=2528008 RepID=A0A518CUY5_9BACT|nr:hypothetical protein Pla163_01310 [Planctomycetes bacterium Pla163]